MSEIKIPLVMFAEGVTYETWTDGYAVGFRATHDDGRIEYIYLNPSSESDDGVPNVFLYHGNEGHPFEDTPIVHVDLFQDITEEN